MSGPLVAVSDAGAWSPAPERQRGAAFAADAVTRTLSAAAVYGASRKKARTRDDGPGTLPCGPELQPRPDVHVGIRTVGGTRAAREFELAAAFLFVLFFPWNSSSLRLPLRGAARRAYGTRNRSPGRGCGPVCCNFVLVNFYFLLFL